jgi:DNA-binding GntR family transcriptional regulator
MPAHIPRIKRQRAVDAVYEVLRDRILASQFQPGERLHIDNLAGKLGVSFTPVQHAVHRLAAEGLVIIKPRKGTFVASLTPRDVEETFDIRCALECLAGEQAALHISEQQLARLRDLLTLMGRPVQTSEERRNHELQNSEFHRAIIAASGNLRLATMYEELNAHLQIGRIHAGRDDGTSRLAQEQAEHESVVDALERRDGQAAAAALQRHIQRAKVALTSSLRAVQQADGA